jgi:hypothetical protein
MYGDGVLGNLGVPRVAFVQAAPWKFVGDGPNLRRTRRRLAFAFARALANHGIAAPTPLLARFARPAAKDDKRWLDGLYSDQPEEWDDPYRFFRW